MRTSSHASAVCQAVRARRAMILLSIALGLALLPGCRLYEFLTGTGYYERDPFLDPNCTSLLLGGEGVMDEFDPGQPSLAAPEDDLLDFPAEAPYVEEDFSGEPPADDFDRIAPPDDESEKFDLEILDESELPSPEPETKPAPEAPPAEQQPEERPFSLDLEPGPEQPSPQQPAEAEPFEDPFPLDVPETEPPPTEAVPEEDLEEMLDLTPEEPAPAPERQPEPEPGPDERELDELDLFDDEISPDLEIDFPETDDESAMDGGADLPSRYYPSARRPEADSYFGRCLLTPRSQDDSRRVAKDRRRGDSDRRPHAFSQSLEIVPPHPGRGIFDTGVDDETETRRATHDVPVPDRR